MKKESPLREYYWVDESNCDGYYRQHGDNVETIYLTLKQFRFVQKTGFYDGCRGKIFKKLISAYYYINN